MSSPRPDSLIACKQSHRTHSRQARYAHGVPTSCSMDVVKTGNLFLDESSTAAAHATTRCLHMNVCAERDLDTQAGQCCMCAAANRGSWRLLLCACFHTNHLSVMQKHQPWKGTVAQQPQPQLQQPHFPALQLLLPMLQVSHQTTVSGKTAKSQQQCQQQCHVTQQK